MSTHKLRSFIIAVGILAVGVIGLMILAALRPDPPRDEPIAQTPIVETVQAAASSGNLSIRGTGTVSAAREVNLSAEVAGRIASVSPSFADGGVFREGDMLLQIDPSDYENAVAVAEAEVTQRMLEVELAEEEAAIARDEWERLQKREGEVQDASGTKLGSLVLREPQMKLAEAVLKSAEARLNDAVSRLRRATVVAPFNGRIQSKLAEVGQYVAPGVVVASFYGTDHAEIVVSLTSDQASLIDDVFRSGASSRNPSARVVARIGNKEYDWKGYVHRINGSLDAATRMFQVVVRVDHPYSLNAGLPPLMVGTYVDIEIEGQALESFFVVPRSALREEDRLWIYNDGRLELRDVNVIQTIQDQIVIDSGLSDGEQIIVSQIAVVADGMSVRQSQ